MKVMMYKGRRVEILQEGPDLTYMQDKGTTNPYWGRTSELREIHVKKPRPSLEERILSTQPSNLSALFLAYLHKVRSQVEIRVHYPPHAESYVFRLFSREGIDLPEDIRPLKSGLRGGITIQRTVAGEMWFPAPEEMNFVPTPYKQTDGQVKISSLAVILSVLKDGFLVTRYAK